MNDSCGSCSHQVGDSCSSARDCGTGLYCGNCPASGRAKASCIRDLAIPPTSIVSFVNAPSPPPPFSVASLRLDTNGDFASYSGEGIAL
jgi:hypothetical protein